MKKDKKIEFDDVIGGNVSKELTKKEHDSIREYRRQLYEKRSSEEKINDILTGFRFSLKNYADQDNPEDVILLGEFLNVLLKQIKIKKGAFAEYIDISPRNINKYFNGERKFTIVHALMLERLFKINAEMLLEVQLKNELIEVKRSHQGEYDKFNLNDLLTV
ncbi:MAG: transcriptional regulator [Crocinitomicaceae bacterium]